MEIPTIFIIDDESSVRDALSMLMQHEGYKTRAFERGSDFLSTYDQEVVGCAIIDISMPYMSGLKLQALMLQRKLILPIIFLTGHGNISMSVSAIKAGATDFLIKPISRVDLLIAVKPALIRSEKKLAMAACTDEAKMLIDHLTVREHEVMMLAVNGFPNKEIARRLNISHRTVEIHKSKIMDKTNAINLLDLASIAREGGCII